jgi:hypothetical protein
MGALEEYYRGQPSSHDAYHAEIDSLHAEAVERGVTIRQVATERREAERVSREAEAERVAAIVNDPALLHRLKAYWNRGITGDWGLQNPLDPPPAPVRHRAGTSAPSSGRQVSGGRTVYGGRTGAGGGGSSTGNDFATAMGRARNRI